MHIIPAIDIIDGKAVRLTQGDYARKKEYADDPLEVARKFEEAGLKRLHLVDLDGARQKKLVNHKVLERIAAGTSLNIDFGGGIQSDEDIRIAFEAGAKQVTGGSIAVRNRDLFSRWISIYGGDKIILGADAREGKIAVGGWQETTEVTIRELLDTYIPLGIKYVICTDVTRDGLLQGPSFGLYQNILQAYPGLKLIASGGVSNKADLEKLCASHLYGAIVGKAYYEGKISLEDLASFENRE